MQTVKKLLAGAKDAAIAAWNKLDPKLKYTALSFVAAQVVLLVGVQADAGLSSAISTAISSFVGYHVPNDGSALRARAKLAAAGQPLHGNASVPDSVDPEAAGPPPENA